jgi:MFS superfamily sulfate permease-like transporter
MQDVAVSKDTSSSTHQDDEPQPTLLNSLKADLPAAIVVMLVALPLCLGIAVASGAPPLTGIVAGVVGGIVVPLISRSQLSVSGPAAGLVAIVLAGVSSLGLEAFAAAVVIAGVLQLALGALRAGRVASWFPSSVVTGMLAAIGVLLILKQIPHTVGWDAEAFGAESFASQGDNTFSRIPHAFSAMSWGAVVVTALSIGALLLFDKVPALRRQKIVPGPLAAVLIGTTAHEAFLRFVPVARPQRRPPRHAARSERAALVADLPRLRSDHEPAGVGPRRDAHDRGEPRDPAQRRRHRQARPLRTPLAAQPRARRAGHRQHGLGHARRPAHHLGRRAQHRVAPRGRAHARSGLLPQRLLARGRRARSPALARIPLASLAAILLLTGYKLAKPTVFKLAHSHGYAHFVPFVVTITAVVLTDLLKGVFLGFAVALMFAVKRAPGQSVEVRESEHETTIKLEHHVPFYARGKLQAALEQIPENGRVVVDARPAKSVHHDVVDAIKAFAATARRRRIEVEVHGLPAS